MGSAKLVGSSVRRASSVKYPFKNQVVEAIRISHELAQKVKDEAEFCTILGVLESVIEAAVEAEYQPDHKKTVRNFNKFLLCLKDQSMTERMEDARRKDMYNVTRAAAQFARLGQLLEKVKKSPQLRHKHYFAVDCFPRRVVITEIPHGAKLPDILWKFRRVCNERTLRNPHFYPDTAYERETAERTLPLRDRDANGVGGKWTARVYVHGDNTDGRIRLTSEDQSIMKLYGAVTQRLTRGPVTQRLPVTLFKDIDGRLLKEEEVTGVFSNASNIKCFRWQGSSFLIDPDVKTLQDLIDRSKRQTQAPASLPPSTESTNVHPPTLHLSTSGTGISPGKMSPSSATPFSSGSSHVDTPFSAETPSSLPLVQAQGPTYRPVPQPPSSHPPSTSGKAVLNPPRQKARSSSSSTSAERHHSVPIPVPTPPRPSHPPPTTPEPRNQNSSSTKPEVAKIQMVLAKEIKSSRSANGGAGLAGSSGSLGITASATVEPQRDGGPTTHHAHRVSPAVDIPQPNPRSRPPLPVPARPSWDGSILSSTPSSVGSSRIDTPSSTATSPSPGIEAQQLSNTNAHTPDSYGTASVWARPQPSPVQLQRDTQAILSQLPPPIAHTPAGPNQVILGAYQGLFAAPLHLIRPQERSWWRRKVDHIVEKVEDAKEKWGY